MKISLPNPRSSSLEKIRMIAPEMESLIKQYKAYVDDGYIDFELFEFTNTPLNFSDLKSKVINKYIYGQGNEFLRIRNDFFSRNSLLHYVEPFKNKYTNFYLLLINEKVNYNDFEDYQKREIDYLITNNYIEIDSDSFLLINNHERIQIFGFLELEDVISYWHYPHNFRDEIDELVQSGILKIDNSLFTIEERRYFNFFLNKKEFTNGLNLRNKYLHGTNTSEIREQETDYRILLKLLLLIILKIEDDLFLYEENKMNMTNNKLDIPDL